MTLRVLKNKIIFEFVETVKKGMFETETDWGLTVTTYYDDSAKKCRVGRVLVVGPEVPPEIQVGDLIVIDALMWTEGVKFEGNMIWQTNSTKVIGVIPE